MNIPIDSDQVNKIQKVVTLLDTTIKMLNSLISLKNTVKKEIYGDKEKEKKEENNNQTNQQPNNNQTSNIIRQDSFKVYLSNIKKVNLL
jgi:hypothetical protein